MTDPDDRLLLTEPCEMPQRPCERCGRIWRGLGPHCERCLNLTYRAEALKREHALLAESPHRLLELTSAPNDYALCHLVLSMNSRLTWCGRRARIGRGQTYRPRRHAPPARLPRGLCAVCRSILDSMQTKEPVNVLEHRPAQAH